MTRDESILILQRNIPILLDNSKTLEEKIAALISVLQAREII